MDYLAAEVLNIDLMKNTTIFCAKDLYDKIVNNTSHKLTNLLSKKHYSYYLEMNINLTYIASKT